MVESQPTAIPSPVSSRREDHSRTAACALVFSLCTLIVCGGSVICLCLSIPALILSIKAITTRGEEQKNSAGASICINIFVVVCTVVVLVAVVTPGAVPAGTRYCFSSYSSSTYCTHCVPYSYSTQGSCSYYSSGYCPLTSSYRCPNFSTYLYNNNCKAFNSNRCTYFSSTYCPSSVYRACPSYYSSSYSTRCVASSSNTRGSRSCSYYASFNTGRCPPSCGGSECSTYIPILMLRELSAVFVYNVLWIMFFFHVFLC